MSYRASNCYFVDDAPGGTGTSIALGASYDLGDNARAALNLYQQRGNFNQTPAAGMDAAQAAALLDPLQLGAMPGNDIFGDLNPALLGLQNAQTERTGVDVEFQVGFSTDQAGDLVLPPRQKEVPNPRRVSKVPEQYLGLLGEHSAHPGEGKGNRARKRLAA